MAPLLTAALPSASTGWFMLLAGEESIREVIPPKTTKRSRPHDQLALGRHERQLAELGLKLR